jgi:hypothetical protein
LPSAFARCSTVRAIKWEHELVSFSRDETAARDVRRLPPPPAPSSSTSRWWGSTRAARS